MIKEFALKNSNYKNEKEAFPSNKSNIKELANDSLFYFGLFLLIIILLHSLLAFGGVTEVFKIGINEIAVCTIGFINIFCIKILKSYLR